MNNQYRCKKCGNPVLVLEQDKPIRSCKCKKPDGSDESIVMDMQIKIEGKSQLNQK